MQTWLVTGGSGFLGRAALDRLKAEGVDLVVVGRRPVAGVRSIPLDLLDCEATRRVLGELAPSVVFHLAGKTPPGSADDLDRSNRLATSHLVDALETIGRPVRLVSAGSAAELGRVPVDRLPVDESYPATPVDPYGTSKLDATRLVLGAAGNVVPIVARVFNPIGPGMPASQAFGSFARQLVEGRGPLALSVGDLSPRRDFIDVRDVAEALAVLGRRGGAGLYHVGTGESRSIAEGLRILVDLSGRDVALNVDPGRSGGVPDSKAAIGRLQRETGWRARISFERSLADLWASVTP